MNIKQTTVDLVIDSDVVVGILFSNTFYAPIPGSINTDEDLVKAVANIRVMQAIANSLKELGTKLGTKLGGGQDD
jgi:hypothetical protein